jgi:hypothetical protein
MNVNKAKTLRRARLNHSPTNLDPALTGDITGTLNVLLNPIETIEGTQHDYTTGSNKRINTQLDIAYPDFATLPEPVKQKYESLPTAVNIFRMLVYSSGTFVEIIDLTNAIFKKLKLSDYHKELPFCSPPRMKAISMNGNNMFQFLRLQACAQSNSLPLRKNALVMLRLRGT